MKPGYPRVFQTFPMPIYEYRCPHCNKVFEEWVHLSDAQSMVPCPDCGTELEVVSLNPITVAEAPEVQEDWGE